MSNKRRVRAVKHSELVLPDPDELPFRPEISSEPSRATLMTPRTTTMRNLHAYARDQWAPKPLRGWLALRASSGWFGIGRTWVPYWCAFDSRYLLLYPTKPGTEESHTAIGYSVTTIDPTQARSTIAVAPDGLFTTDIPVPSMMIDLGYSTIEAQFEGGSLYAIIRRPNFPDYVLCGNHIKIWIHEWQKIGMSWKDEDGKTVDVPTDVVDKSGKVMEPRMDSAERFFLRQQGAFLLYMAGPLQFEAWNSRTGGKWFLHFCTFDAYDPVPSLSIYSDGTDPEDDSPPKIVILTGASITEHLDERQRSKMKIELPGKPALICDGPNIQWWLGALQWATRDRSTQTKSMFRDLIKHRRFIPVEKSISVLRMQRRASIQSIKRRTQTGADKDNATELEDASARPGTADGNVDGTSTSGTNTSSTANNKLFQSAAPNANAGRSLIQPGSTTRLSAAEFARQNQVGPSPPKARRRSSAPKPDALAEIRAHERRGRADSRAQIPLISLSVGDTDGQQSANPSSHDDQAQDNMAKRKSPRRKTKEGGASSPPNGGGDALATTSNLTVSKRKSEKRKSDSKNREALLTEDDIPKTPKENDSPLADSAAPGTRSPTQGRSPRAGGLGPDSNLQGDE